MIALGSPHGELKLVPEPAGTRGGYDDLRRAATREPIGKGLRPRVASIADLARMLAALGREQDIRSLQQLRYLRELERGPEPRPGTLNRPNVGSSLPRTGTITVGRKRDTDAPRCKYGSWFVYALYVSRRRLRRRSEKAQRHAPPLDRSPTPLHEIVREATRVERLAYTRTQAAEALGVSRSTFNRRVLPLVETIEMPWGARLIPVDELQRLIAERRRRTRAREQPRASPGRPADAGTRHRRADPGRARRRQRAWGIARELNADQVPTAHNGAQWWPSTVRAVLRRRPRTDWT